MSIGYSYSFIDLEEIISRSENESDEKIECNSNSSEQKEKGEKDESF